VQGELHASLDAPVRPHIRNDDLGLSNAVASALPLAGKASRLLRQTGAKRQQKGKDGKDDPLQQDVSPSATRHDRSQYSVYSPRRLKPDREIPIISGTDVLGNLAVGVLDDSKSAFWAMNRWGSSPRATL